MKTVATSLKPARRPLILSLSRLAPLLVPLLVALTLRLLLWDQIPRTGLISDEGEYLSAANWLAHGRGFAWYHDYLWTRAPLYPLFVAIHLRLFGDTLVPVWISQTILSLVNVALVYLLARHLFPTTDSPDKVTRRQGGKVIESLDHSSSMTGTRSPAHPLTRSPVHLRGRWSIPMLAALLMAVYFPFALYPQVLLSETLFLTLLLSGFLALAHWNAKNTGGQRSVVSGQWSAVAGALFGLATLTRSLTLFFLPIVTLWLLTRRPTTDDRRPTTDSFTFHVSRFSVLGALCFALTAAAVILPWSVYNSRLYGGMVAVDTSGAFNLLLGARTAYDGGRQDAPSRNFVLALLDKNLDPAQRLKLLDEQRSPDGRLLAARSCLLDRQDAGLQAALERPPGTALAAAERQQLMMAEGLCFISARPGAFVAKSLMELADLFQINYSGDERFSDGYTTGRLPPWYALGLFVLDDTLYILALPLAVLGWALARRLRTEDRGSKIEDSNLVASERLSSIRYPLSSLIGLWWLYNIAVAPLLFAINRFRLPLLPFAFIFVAYALVALPARWRLQRRRAGLLWGALAALLLLVATTPYAYLQPPRDPAASSQAQPVWTASYLGPDPSSLSSTGWALARRARYQATERLQRALGAGNQAEAETILRSSDLDPRVATLGRALLAGQQGRYDQGLAILEADRVLAGDTSYRPFVGVVRGDLLRAKGDLTAARAAFTPEFVDNANPVQWAWDWLRPTPLPDNSIDLAGNLDLGYIEGCYLGEGDRELRTNFRWCTDGARLRFPGAGTGAPQALVLRTDGRFWPDDMLPVPPVRVLLAGQEAGAFTPDHAEIRDFVVVLPPAAPGADVVVTLRTPVFIPSAADYLKQQGALVGQARRLGVRLDRVELREPGP